MRSFLLKNLFTASTLVAALIIGSFIFVTSSNAVDAASISFNPLPGIGGDTGSTIDGGKLSNTGLGTADPVQVSSRIINALLQVLGLFSLALFLYGGFLWIWARGNSETIEKAKDVMTGTVIGLVLILSAYGITQWVFVNLVTISRG